MIIFNRSTHQLGTLTYYDRAKDAAQQQDSAPDLTTDDPAITFNPSEERMEADQNTIDYWRTWFTKSEAADDLEHELRQTIKELPRPVRDDMERSLDDLCADVGGYHSATYRTHVFRCWRRFLRALKAMRSVGASSAWILWRQKLPVKSAFFCARYSTSSKAVCLLYDDRV
jgi:hypothetical protein